MREAIAHERQEKRNDSRAVKSSLWGKRHPPPPTVQPLNYVACRKRGPITMDPTTDYSSDVCSVDLDNLDSDQKGLYAEWNNRRSMLSEKEKLSIDREEEDHHDLDLDQNRTGLDIASKDFESLLLSMKRRRENVIFLSSLSDALLQIGNETEAVFALADVDKNGTISKDEFRVLAKMLGCQMSAFDVIDFNGDGSISQEELLAFRIRDHISNVFQCMSSMHNTRLDALLDHDELFKALWNHPHRNEICSILDNRIITFHEFMQMNVDINVVGDDNKDKASMTVAEALDNHARTVVRESFNFGDYVRGDKAMRFLNIMFHDVGIDVKKVVLDRDVVPEGVHPDSIAFDSLWRVMARLSIRTVGQRHMMKLAE